MAPLPAGSKSPHDTKKSSKNGPVTWHEGRFVGDKKVGPWKAYDTSGKLTKTTNRKASS
jgi:antitoxin component YwqK of YwqJK toxin-antitoxin module